MPVCKQNDENDEEDVEDVKDVEIGARDEEQDVKISARVEEQDVKISARVEEQNVDGDDDDDWLNEGLMGDDFGDDIFAAQNSAPQGFAQNLAP